MPDAPDKLLIAPKYFGSIERRLNQQRDSEQFTSTSDWLLMEETELLWRGLFLPLC